MTFAFNSPSRHAGENVSHLLEWHAHPKKNIG